LPKGVKIWTNGVRYASAMIIGGKMKYKRMLCWVDEQEKQAIMQSNINKIDILFADNEEMFILEINNYDFHVVSIHKANDNLVKSFPNIRFLFYFKM
jgi:hypothetical protein